MIGIEIFFPLGHTGIHNLAKDAIFNALVSTTPNCPSKDDMFIENNETKNSNNEICLKIRELHGLSLADCCGYMPFCSNLIKIIDDYVGEGSKKVICHFIPFQGDVIEIVFSTKKQI